MEVERFINILKSISIILMGFGILMIKEHLIIVLNPSTMLNVLFIILPISGGLSIGIGTGYLLFNIRSKKKK